MSSERFEIKNIEEAFEIIKDDSLKEVYEKYLLDFENEREFSGVYTSKKDIVDSIKERIFDSFEEKYREIKSDVSTLRKKGYEVNVLDFYLLKFNYKKKLLEADFSLENYNIVVDLFKGVEPEIKKMVKEMEKKEMEDYKKEKEESDRKRNKKEDSTES